MKSDPDLKRIPIVILTTSRAEDDVLNSYDLHVNCYVTKPFDLTEFVRLMRCIDEFWLSVVTLPPA